MGRHASRSQWHFYRSLSASVLPWVLGAAAVIAVVVIAVNALNPDTAVTARNRPLSSSGGNEPSSPVPVETPDEPGPSPSPTPKSKDGKDQAGKREDKTRPSPGNGLITSGITVQVLNATGWVEGAAAAMADRLAGLGYEVIAVNTAYGNYDGTVVYWSTSESQPAAEALAAHFGWTAKPRLENLSTTVDLHVVVGRDEVP